MAVIALGGHSYQQIHRTAIKQTFARRQIDIFDFSHLSDGDGRIGEHLEKGGGVEDSRYVDRSPCKHLDALIANPAETGPPERKWRYRPRASRFLVNDDCLAVPINTLATICFDSPNCIAAVASETFCCLHSASSSRVLASTSFDAGA